MELDLVGKTVLVTGASSGIGRATAAAFAAEGADVMLSARRERELKEAAGEAATGAGAADWVAADFATLGGPARAVAATVERFGRLDVLVNNAAPNPLGGLADTDDEQIVGLLQGKPLGYLRAVRAALPHLQASGGGVIINVAGMSARHATHGYLVGTMATRAIHGMTKSLSDELGPGGTRVVGVDPGPTETEHFRVNAVERFATERGATAEEIVAEFAGSVPLGYIAEPAQIADVIVFLASRRADFITGTSVLVDGGRYAVDRLSEEERMNLLEGIRVLDVTEALAGPYCTAILSDLGAEVVKLERVDGDPMRRRRASADGVSVPFEMIQRGKRSVALDFRQPEGAEALLRLAGNFDVLVENFRPGVLRKYGLAPDRMRERHPSLIYCSISGFGQTGPLRDEKGVDLVAQGFAGLMSVTGFADKGPAKAGYPIGDLGSAMWSAIGICAALQRRSVSGEGCVIDVSLTDAIASWSLWEVADYQMSGLVPEALGTAHRLTAPYQAFPCRDGRWVTMAGLDRQWPELCRLLEVEHLVEDSRFATEYSRFEHRDALGEALEARFLTRDRDDWIAALRSAGVPCGPVHDMETMLDEPQFQARGMFVDMEIGGAGVRLVNTPIVADGVPRVHSPSPTTGEATVEYLTDAGYSEDEIEALAAAGIVGIGGGGS